MRSKTLPCIAESVKFINACAGARLVRAKDRIAIAPTHIDFLLAPSFAAASMNRSLEALWRKLGHHTRAVRISGNEVVRFYEWNFKPPAGKLRLMLRSDGVTIVRLSNQVTERRTGDRAEYLKDRRLLDSLQIK